ncbi:hypothetical protein Cgig2_004701 [Carnegiea gigantea]|uniref:Uncharacterized protein n=1 Tax=Carnegiea gigantea TaxID=171969 RepID=A0A9Q1GNA3_9CARY|nr:hypothetical protein Cgig2_004701 [Carnegiea gigantea]
MKGTSTMEVGADGVAIITIVNPPVNSLSLDDKEAIRKLTVDSVRLDVVLCLLERGHRAIAVTDNASVLILTVLQSLKVNFDEALGRDDVKAIVVTGANGKFSGGFDITAFGEIQGGKITAPKRGLIAIDLLTDTVDAARKPSVAAIDGLALGGGLEVAMACHARISTAGAQLGLPELQLGILPGFGGIVAS